MKYTDKFTNFLIILESISPRALDLFCQDLEGRGIQSLRKLRYNNEDYLTDPDLCFKNLKSQLRYSSTLGCIVGSTLLKEETCINIYSDIPNVITKIKSSNRIAKAVRVYILQIPLLRFPLVVIALISNKESDTVEDIEKLHKRLIEEIVPQLHLHILSLGSDGAITEFQIQQSILNTQTSEKLIFCEFVLNFNFSCPIIDEVGPIIRVQDPKHAKKTARNAVMSDACLLTFGQSFTRFQHFLNLINRYDSIMYKNDVIKLDRQDDSTVYRTFCSSNFKQCLGKDFDVELDMEGFAVYLFMM
ncbi:26195_t:CDS:2, partial [Gigaspora margarita]